MVSTEDSEASWFILFWVFVVVVVVFPAAGSFIVFILRSLSSGGGLLFFFFFFFSPPFPHFFSLSADFQVTKRSPAGGASTYTQKPA